MARQKDPADADPKLEIVTVFESDDPIAFELAKAVLDDAGVQYRVWESPAARFGFSPILHPVRRILMPAWRKDEALQLIAEAQSQAHEDDAEDIADDQAKDQTGPEEP